MYSDSFKKRLIKNFKLPIRIIEEPYFSYYLNLYQKNFKIEEKIEIMKKSIEMAGSETELMNLWYKVKDEATLSISSNPEFKEFQRFESEYQVKNKIQNKNLYNHQFINNTCVSVDLITANYSVLKKFNPRLVFNTENFKEFILRYTKVPLFQESKIFRQLLFETLDHKKNGDHQKNIILQTLDLLNSELTPLYSLVINNDELILVFNKTEDLIAIETVVQSAVDKTPYNQLMKVEAFNLIPVYQEVFNKITKNSSVLKNAPVSLYPQLFKKANDLEINPDLDLAFIDSETGILSKYLKPIF